MRVSRRMPQPWRFPASRACGGAWGWRAPGWAGAAGVYVSGAGLAWDAGSVFAPLGPRARCEADLDALVAAIAAEAHEADHVLVMSNGGFGGIHQKLLTALAKA